MSGQATLTRDPNAVGCGCGNANCGVCADGNFVRPRFFAGQLLTEEDLELLTAYTAGKQRLHNKMLFGDGVVNGMSVTCSQTESTTIWVSPGYALDCCGNDIVVGCSQKIDINALLREAGLPLAVAPVASGLTAIRRNYELIVEYCEQLSNPVSPYSTEGDCIAQACELSRVQEGFAFRIRTPIDTPAQVDAASQAADCLRSIRNLDGMLNIAEELGRCGRDLELALNASDLDRENVPTPLSFDRDAFDLMYAALNEPAWVTDIDLSEPNPVEVRRLLELYGHDAGLYSRLLFDPDAWLALRPNLSVEEQLGPQLLKDLLGVRNVRASADTDGSGASDLVELFADDMLVQSKMAAIEDMLGRVNAAVANWTDFSQAPGDGDNTVTVQNPTPPPATRQVVDPVYTAFVESVEGRLLAEGMVYTTELHNVLIPELRAWKALLVTDVDLAELCGSDNLLRTLQSMTFPRTIDLNDPTDGLLWSDVIDMVDAISLLWDTMFRLFLDCMCTAAMPVQNNCDTTTVVLATLEVEDDQIVRVCNSTRKFVLAPATIRHWVPPLSGLGNLLDQACCSNADSPCDPTTVGALRAMVTLGAGGTIEDWINVFNTALGAHPANQVQSGGLASSSSLFTAIGDLAGSCLEEPSAGLVAEIDALQAQVDELMARLVALEQGDPTDIGGGRGR